MMAVDNYLLTACCFRRPMENTEWLYPDGTWVGRCSRCREMSLLEKESDGQD